MNLWRNLVFVRLIIPFILGMILADYFRTLPVVVVISCLVFASFILQVLRFSISFQWVPGIFLYIGLFIFGSSLMQEKQTELIVPSIEPSKEFFTLQILSEAQEKDNSFKYLAQVVYHPNTLLNGERLLLYIDKTQGRLPNNAIVYCDQYINRIKSPLNPHAFNYQKYMDSQGVHFQAYLSQKHIVSKEQQDVKLSYISKLKQYCKKVIFTYIVEDVQQLAMALLLGNKQGLNNETKTTFQRSGTMHILAVSGLHVGIIYVLLITILSAINKAFPLPKYFQLILLIAGIVLFALLTGAKASVVRAATMFSLFALGNTVFKTTNSLNILAAVAFVMLCYNPLYVYDVGFQLSFSAVAGIVLLLPLYKLIRSRYSLVNYFSGILFMSFAAQLSTLPFVIYYFHQLPLIGLLSNFLAIPLAFASVFIGFLLLICSPIFILSKGLGLILTGLLRGMQYSNKWFSSFHGAVIDSLYIEAWQATLLFTGIACFIIHANQCYLATIFGRKKGYFTSLQFGLLAMIILSISISWHKHTQYFINSVTVYSLPNQYALEVRQGHTATLFSEKIIDIQDFEYSIFPNHLASSIRHVNQYTIEEHVEDYFLLRDSLLIFDSISISFGNHLHANYIVRNEKPQCAYRNTCDSVKYIVNQYSYTTEPSSIHSLKSSGFITLLK